MTTHANVAAASGLPRPSQAISFIGDGDYRMRTAAGWVEIYAEADWQSDARSPSISIWGSKAMAEAGTGPMCLMTREWFRECAIEVLGNREAIQS